MKTVTIYTTSQCHFCLQLKEYLEKSGFAFREFNVIEDPDRLDEMKAFSGGSLTVPVVVFNKGLPGQSCYVGFQPDVIDRELSFRAGS